LKEGDEGGAGGHEGHLFERGRPHFREDLGAAEDRGGIVDDRGAGRGDLLIADGCGLAGAPLDKDLMARFYEAADAVGDEGEAALSEGGLRWYTDTHLGATTLSPKGGRFKRVKIPPAQMLHG
jgi:hypothetical protein